MYLTADSPHELVEIKADKVYIIGGIVDRNKYRGLTYEKATKEGISTARLPINDIRLQHGTTVLTVNTMVDMLLHVVTAYSSGANDMDTTQVAELWRDAFQSVLPQRKGLLASKLEDQNSTRQMRTN